MTTTPTAPTVPLSQPPTIRAAQPPAIPLVQWPAVADGAATVLTGLFAGFFGTYSFSVVRGLAIVDDTTYVESFQAINATIRNAEFALVFFGALPALILAAVLNHRSQSRPQQGVVPPGEEGLTEGSDSTQALLRMAAGLLVLATMVVTFVGNVPLNNDLAAVEATQRSLGQGAATEARAAFESTWNQLNLLRTGLSVAAFGCSVAVLLRGRVGRTVTGLVYV